MTFYWWANTLLKYFLTLKVTIKIVEKTCTIFPHGTTKFFFSTLSCVGIFISLPGGITHLSYTVTLMRFVISILQKMLWINCSPTMVDCGPSIKPHCASNRGTVHRTEVPSVIFFFFFPRDQPNAMGGKPMRNKPFYGDGHVPVCDHEGQEIHKNSVNYCKEGTFTVLTR